MGTIIYDARRIKAYERMQELAQFTGRDAAFIEELWRELVLDGNLMKEFVYYLDHHTLLDEMKCEGYGLTDLYFWLLQRDNLMQDYGKNNADCNKEGLVLDAFWMMTEMKKDPQKYVKILNSEMGMGMDWMS